MKESTREGSAPYKPFDPEFSSQPLSVRLQSPIRFCLAGLGIWAMGWGLMNGFDTIHPERIPNLCQQSLSEEEIRIKRLRMGDVKSWQEDFPVLVASDLMNELAEDLKPHVLSLRKMLPQFGNPGIVKSLASNPRC